MLQENERVRPSGGNPRTARTLNRNGVSPAKQLFGQLGLYIAERGISKILIGLFTSTVAVLLSFKKWLFALPGKITNFIYDLGVGFSTLMRFIGLSFAFFGSVNSGCSAAFRSMTLNLPVFFEVLIIGARAFCSLCLAGRTTFEHFSREEMGKLKKEEILKVLNEKIYVFNDEKDAKALGLEGKELILFVLRRARARDFKLNHKMTVLYDNLHDFSRDKSGFNVEEFRKKLISELNDRYDGGYSEEEMESLAKCFNTGLICMKAFVELKRVLQSVIENSNTTEGLAWRQAILERCDDTCDTKIKLRLFSKSLLHEVSLGRALPNKLELDENTVEFLGRDSEFHNVMKVLLAQAHYFRRNAKKLFKNKMSEIEQLEKSFRLYIRYKLSNDHQFVDPKAHEKKTTTRWWCEVYKSKHWIWREIVHILDHDKGKSKANFEGLPFDVTAVVGVEEGVDPYSAANKFYSRVAENGTHIVITNPLIRELFKQEVERIARLFHKVSGVPLPQLIEKVRKKLMEELYKELKKDYDTNAEIIKNHHKHLENGNLHHFHKYMQRSRDERLKQLKDIEYAGKYEKFGNMLGKVLGTGSAFIFAGQTVFAAQLTIPKMLGLMFGIVHPASWLVVTLVCISSLVMFYGSNTFATPKIQNMARALFRHIDQGFRYFKAQLNKTEMLKVTYSAIMCVGVVCGSNSLLMWSLIGLGCPYVLAIALTVFTSIGSIILFSQLVYTSISATEKAMHTYGKARTWKGVIFGYTVGLFFALLTVFIATAGSYMGLNKINTPHVLTCIITFGFCIMGNIHFYLRSTINGFIDKSADMFSFFGKLYNLIKGVLGFILVTIPLVVAGLVITRERSARAARAGSQSQYIPLPDKNSGDELEQQQEKKEVAHPIRRTMSGTKLFQAFNNKDGAGNISPPPPPREQSPGVNSDSDQETGNVSQSHRQQVGASTPPAAMEQKQGATHLDISNPHQPPTAAELREIDRLLPRSEFDGQRHEANQQSAPPSPIHTRLQRTFYGKSEPRVPSCGNSNLEVMTLPRRHDVVFSPYILFSAAPAMLESDLEQEPLSLGAPAQESSRCGNVGQSETESLKMLSLAY